RAATALIRLGPEDAIWDRLTYSPDPRLRSFLVNCLSPLGANPEILASKLEQIPANARQPAPGPRFMDEVLFHPETSQRRARLLALGTFGTDDLFPEKRMKLIAKLLDLYQHDPDAGIHGATEWTLLQWEQQTKLLEVDAKLPKNSQDRGNRRWYVNGQGQT